MLKKFLFPLSMIILSMAGILLAYILAEEFHFMDLPPYDGHTPGFFNQISSQVCGDAKSFYSCESVSKSKYAVVLGFPMALYGLFFYLLTFFMSIGLLFRPHSVRSAIAIALFWLAALGFIFDMGLLIVSFVRIKALCPLCLFTYAVTFLLLGLSSMHLVRAKTNPIRLAFAFKSEDGRIKISSVAAGAILLALIVMASAGLAHGANTFLIKTKIVYIAKYKDSEIKRIVAAFAVQKEELVQIPLLYVHGDPDAPVTLIEISDFLCPYCAHTAQLIDELFKDNPQKLKVLFANFPLDITCNRFMGTVMHQGACDLAKAAICAASQDAMAAYQRAAFANRYNHPTQEDIAKIAASAGLDQNEFERCLANPTTQEVLRWQIEAANGHGINSTPTLFINNKRYQGRMYKEALQQIIDLEVKRTQASR